MHKWPFYYSSVSARIHLVAAWLNRYIWIDVWMDDDGFAYAWNKIEYKMAQIHRFKYNNPISFFSLITFCFYVMMTSTRENSETYHVLYSSQHSVVCIVCHVRQPCSLQINIGSRNVIIIVGSISFAAVHIFTALADAVAAAANAAFVLSTSKYYKSPDNYFKSTQIRSHNIIIIIGNEKCDGMEAVFERMIHREVLAHLFVGCSRSFICRRRRHRQRRPQFHQLTRHATMRVYVWARHILLSSGFNAINRFACWVLVCIGNFMMCMRSLCMISTMQISFRFNNYINIVNLCVCKLSRNSACPFPRTYTDDK